MANRREFLWMFGGSVFANSSENATVTTNATLSAAPGQATQVEFRLLNETDTRLDSQLVTVNAGETATNHVTLTGNFSDANLAPGDTLEVEANTTYGATGYEVATETLPSIRPNDTREPTLTLNAKNVTVTTNATLSVAPAETTEVTFTLLNESVELDTKRVETTTDEIGNVTLEGNFSNAALDSGDTLKVRADATDGDTGYTVENTTATTDARPGGNVTAVDKLLLDSVSFTSTPSSPEINQEITLDASDSSDDSGIDTYEWDLNDDGTFEASGQTTTTSFDSPGDYTITLRVTDTNGASSTAEETLTVSKTAFQQIKEAHLETAQTVDDATIDTVQQGVSGIGVTSEAQAANDAYTEAVENGDISEDTAVSALRRLDRGIGLTGTVAKRIGPQPEGTNDTNDVDLTQSMAAPTIRTVVNLAAGISSMGKAADSADDIGLIKGEIIETAKEQVINGINSVIKYVLGESSDIAGTVKTEGNKIAEDLLNNGFETAAEVNDVIDTVTSRIVESASVALQTYVEQGNALGTPEVPQLTGTVFEDSPLTLDGGATLMYEALSADRVSSNGLVGSTTTAASAASTARQNIKDVAGSAQSNIEAISGVADEFNIGESLVSLIQDPDIFSGIKTVISVITSLLGSFIDALATGAGIGGLIEINIRHHVGLYSIIQGETV